MREPSVTARDWARQIMAMRSDSNKHEPALVHICEKLRVLLTPFVGPDGVTALVRRALSLARIEVPALVSTTLSPDGSLEVIEEFLANGELDAQAAGVLAQHMLQLLIVFIGEPLTLRLIRDSLPGTCDRGAAENEDCG